MKLLKEGWRPSKPGKTSRTGWAGQHQWTQGYNQHLLPSIPEVTRKYLVGMGEVSRSLLFVFYQRPHTLFIEVTQGSVLVGREGLSFFSREMKDEFSQPR